MSRLFDKTSLLNQELPEMKTRRLALPQGEVVAQIVDMDFKSGTIKQGDRTGEAWNRLDFKLEIMDRDYLANYGDGSQEKATTTYGVMVEMTPNGDLLTGENKNLKLGRLRHAAGVNGKPLSALVGQFIKIRIDHKPHPTDVEDDGSPVILDEIGAVGKVE